MAERMRLAIESEPIDVSDTDAELGTVAVTASLGAAVSDAESAAMITSPEHLVRVADKALYAAKDAGRNCVRVFNARPRPSAAA